MSVEVWRTLSYGNRQNDMQEVRCQSPVLSVPAVPGSLSESVPCTIFVDRSCVGCFRTSALLPQFLLRHRMSLPDPYHTLRRRCSFLLQTFLQPSLCSDPEIFSVYDNIEIATADCSGNSSYYSKGIPSLLPSGNVALVFALDFHPEIETTQASPNAHMPRLHMR